MADCYRPSEPEFDYSRRTSHPNLTWRRQPSPPRGPSRPSAPPRSNTMDPSRDPRRKRPSSRSPDGAQARKQLKPGQVRDGIAAQTNDNSSRRSSISNGTPKHPNGLASSPNSRAMAQASKDSSKEGRALFVNPVNARDSPVRDTSGRSTPLDKINGSTASNSKAMNGSSSNINSTQTDATTTPESILALLTNFSEEVAQQAALKISREQAKARADRLQLEYNSTRDKFAAFPAIRERKTTDKEAAFKEFGTRDERLSTHKASQTKLMNTLAIMISHSVSRTDQVSRVEHDDLVKKFDKANELFKNQREQLKVLKQAANDTSTATKDVASRLESHEKDTSALLEEVKQQIDSYGSTAKNLVTKDALDKLEEQHLEQRQQLDKKVTDLQINLAKVKAESSAAASCDASIKVSNGDKAKIERILKDAQAAIKKFDDLQEKVDNVAKRVDDLKKEFNGNMIRKDAGGLSKVGNVDSNNEHQLSDIRERLKTIEDDMATNEKLLQQRDDEIANWVQTEVAKADSNTEVKEVKRLHGEIERKVQDFASRQVSLDLFNKSEMGIQAKLTKLEEEIKSLQTQHQKPRKDSQPSIVQAAPPQYTPGLHQMPNGMGHPQAPNGVTRSPSLNTAPSPRFGSPHGAMQPPQKAAPDLNKLQEQINGLSVVFQHLKQRYDNIQTDELMRGMADQMSQMYPHAKNFDAAVNNLGTRVNQLRTDLDQEQNARKLSVKDTNHQMSEIKKASDEAKQTALDGKKLAQDVDKKLITLDKGVNAELNRGSETLEHLGKGFNTVSENVKKDILKIGVEIDTIKTRLVEYEVEKESQAEGRLYEPPACKADGCATEMLYLRGRPG